MRDIHARARTRVLTGGPLGKEEVPGLIVAELKAFAIAMGLSGSSKNKLKELRAVCNSWFKKNGGPFVLREDRAVELRRLWPDAEARVARLLEERAAAAPPPPDAETKKQYEACGAAPSHPRRATNNPANAGSKRRTPTRRTPRTSKRSSCATRRPSRPSSRSSDAPLAARRLAAVPCYDRERAASLREGDAASGATRRRKSPFLKQTHFTRRGRGRAAARFTPDIAAGTWPDKKRCTRSAASVYQQKSEPSPSSRSASRVRDRQRILTVHLQARQS